MRNGSSPCICNAGRLRPFIRTVKDIWAWTRIACATLKPLENTDFSVALFRPDFMLASEKYPMKAHKNQQLLAMLCSPDSLMEPGARGQTIVPEVQKPSQWPCMRRLLREV